MTSTTDTTTVDLWIDSSPQQRSGDPARCQQSQDLRRPPRHPGETLDGSGAVIGVDAEGVPVQQDARTGDLVLEPDRAT